MIKLVKFNVEFDESVSESMLAILVGIIKKIKKSPKKNPDQIILDYLKNYYEKRKPLEHFFSNVIIDHVKNEIILNIIDVNKEKFEYVSQPVMNDLVNFFKDFFIDVFYKYKNNIEINEDTER